MEISDWISLAAVIAAGVAVFFAGRANKFAKDSRKIAESANELSADSNDIAREANRIAVDANESNEELRLEFSAAESRKAERHDVVWEGDWPRPGSYVLTNTGEDEAFNVIATISVERTKQEVRAERVGPGETLTFDFSAEMRQLMQERDRTRDQYRNALGGGLGLPAYRRRDDHVSWVTRLKNHKIHEGKSVFDDLGLG